MLDTFAKRLASQCIPSPGDINTNDRWAIGGAFKPTIASGGALVIAFGSLVAAFAGTLTAPSADYDTADRYHIERRPYPGSGSGIGQRYAIGGSFYSGTPTNDRSGKIASAVGGLSASLRGAVTFTPLFDYDDRLHLQRRPLPGVGIGVENRFAIGGSFYQLEFASSDGRLNTTFGGLVASFRGGALYSHFFDVDYSITPNFVVTDMPPSSGAITAALGGLTSVLQGSALPPDSSSGRIQATLGALSAALQGTMTPPAARDGRLHLDLGTLSAALRGAAVPPQGVVGGVQSRLGDVAASLRGTFTAFAASGLISVDLGSLGASMRGQSIQPGAIVGRINVALGGLQVAFIGHSLSNQPPTPPSRTFRPKHGQTTFRAAKGSTTKKA